jgi:hypothetical protein
MRIAVPAIEPMLTDHPMNHLRALAKTKFRHNRYAPLAMIARAVGGGFVCGPEVEPLA